MKKSSICSSEEFVHWLMLQDEDLFFNVATNDSFGNLPKIKLKKIKKGIINKNNLIFKKIFCGIGVDPIIGEYLTGAQKKRVKILANFLSDVFENISCYFLEEKITYYLLYSSKFNHYGKDFILKLKLILIFILKARNYALFNN